MTDRQFTGTGVALVTPFSKGGSIDYNALEKLVDHVLKGGVDYLVAMGTTAETPTLTGQEKKDLLAAIKKFCAGRKPIVCGIGGNNTAEVVAQLKEMDLDGVEAILSVAPYYNKPSQEGMYQHFKAVANASPKPIILYNVPGRTSSNLLPATVAKLANDFANIVAIKEASGNLVQCMELMQLKPERLVVLSGDDNLFLPQAAIGMEGIISVAANCFTSDMTDMINLALVGRFDKSKKIFYKLLPGIDLLFAEGNPSGVKCVLKHMGMCENILRLPLVPVSDATNKKIGQLVKGNQ